MPNWKKLFGIKETKEIVKETGRVLDHEAIHGAIMYILWKDKFNGEIELEWPLYHGFDKQDTKEHRKDE